jgi:hypothetical protein
MRRIVVALATVGLVVLVLANVITALSASNAVPTTRADDDSVIAPPPDSMLRKACEALTADQPPEEPQTAAPEGCPQDNSVEEACPGECSQPSPEAAAGPTEEQQPCTGAECGQSPSPTPEPELTPSP